MEITPAVSRPSMKGYGLPEDGTPGPLRWGEIEGKLAEARKDRARERVVIQEIGRVRFAGRYKRPRDEAGTGIRSLRHDDIAVNVGEVDAAQPADTLVVRRREPELEARVRLIALLELVAVAGRRAVRRQKARNEAAIRRHVEERRRKGRIERARIV